jgi:hypothetical protein
MDRRNFFKGMFGAAVVAFMPKIVVEQIEKVPINEITPVPVLKKPKQVIFHLGEKCMYLYDDNQLIAGSTLFDLEFQRKVISLPTWEGYDQYVMGESEWKIAVEQLRWFNSETGLRYFEESKPLKCVIHYKGTEYMGYVLITECRLSCGIDTPIQEDVMLTGTGSLIMTTKDEQLDSSVQKQIGESKGSVNAIGKLYNNSPRGLKGK